jgi:hypothetical protein
MVANLDCAAFNFSFILFILIYLFLEDFFVTMKA